MGNMKELEDEILGRISGGMISEENENKIYQLIRILKTNPLTNNKQMAARVVARSFDEGGWENFASTNSEEDKQTAIQLLLDTWDNQ